VADGGLDAIIEDGKPSNEDIIPAGTVGFQVKSSDVSDCEDEVTTGNGVLQKRIADVLDADGTYILVVFEQLAYANEKMGKNKLEKRKDEFEKVFSKFDYQDAKVRIYDSNKLVGFFNRFPGMVASIRGISHAIDYSHWGREITNEIETFVSDTARDEYRDTIRELLRTKTNGLPVVRVTGPSGVGKTRLVYETLGHDDLRNQVIFAQADRFKRSDLADLLRLKDQWNAIIVLEDCDPDTHEELAEQFGPYDRLSLITTSDNPTQVTADEQFQLEPLATADIAQLLQDEFPNASETKRIARFSEGFPKIASLLAKNVSSENGSSENLLHVDEAPLERLIGGREYNRDQLNEHKRVLEVFSLFERVGWRTANEELHDESEWVAEVAGFEGQDGMARFTDIVSAQKERGVLQGENYLSVTPLPLATHLMQSWLDKHGTGEIEDLLASMPATRHMGVGDGDMRSRFGSRIPYMTASRVGQRWISDKLGPNGPYYENDGAAFNTEWGSKLFLRLAEASPSEAVRPLEVFVNERSVDQLREFSTGRRNVVHALERMTVWEESFSRAARILLALGEAENEDWGNNASGVFTELFSPAPGKVAPTEVSPMDRFPLLEEALHSDSTRRQKLGIDAIDAALETDHFVRNVGREYQGARPTPNLWHPDSHEDFVEYYRAVWNLLATSVDDVDEAVRDDAVDALVQNVRGVAKVNADLSELIRDSLEDLINANSVDTQKVIRTVVNLIRYESDTLEGFGDQLEQWKALLARISDETYEGRVQRYVGLSLLADDDIYEERLEELAKESLSHLDQFKAQLPWLVTVDPNARRARMFGKEIGNRDESNQVLNDIVDAFRDAGDQRDVNFLSGYLSALQKRDAAARQDVLAKVEADEDLHPYLANLARLSGMTTADAERLIDAIRDDKIEPTALRGLETGGASRRIDEPVFRELSSLLLNQEIEAADVLLPIFHMYYVYPDEGPQLPHDITINLLTHPAFVEVRGQMATRQGLSHDWKDVAEEFLAQFPNESSRISEVIMDIIGRRRTALGSSHAVKELLGNILKSKPEETWNIITNTLTKRDERLVTLAIWLRGDGPHSDGTPIKNVPADWLWEWVEEDVDNHAPVAALLVPAELFHSNSEVCLAREILVRYGDRGQVRDALHKNDGPVAYVGLSSKHYDEIKERLVSFKNEETNPQVIRWVEDEIRQLEDEINASEQFEERIGIDE